MATRPKPDTRVASKPKIGSCPIDLGNRICIYGRGGKTSLSRALGDQTGLPVIELDAIFWQPNWVERDHDDMLKIVKSRIAEAEDGWIIEGNYRRIRPHVLPMADTVIWLNLPRWSTTLRVAKRTFMNAFKRTQICGENYESFRTALSPSSIIWYNAFHARKSQTEIADALRISELKAEVYEIRTYRQLREFYASCGLDHHTYRT